MKQEDPLPATAHPTQLSKGVVIKGVVMQQVFW